MFQLIWNWAQSNVLAVVALGITLYLIYQYIIEKETGIRLTKKYRDSIFETQSKIFLNASQYLIAGEKDLAIREFMNAVDLNRETLETYFALGKLFRSNGQIDKAISLHRSVIAREGVSEAVRLQGLKELAIDFDKGGFIDKALETYKDVLKVNRDQSDIILAICRIYEDTKEWDQAYKYRIMLSKISHENQAETISHILVEKAKTHFDQAEYQLCEEELEEAFKYAPSVSAQILELKINLIRDRVEQAKEVLMELLREYPMYTSFVFVSLEEIHPKHKDYEKYTNNYDLLKKYFIDVDDIDLHKSSSVTLTKVRLLKEQNLKEQALELLKFWIDKDGHVSDVLRVEYVKLLIEMGLNEEALSHTKMMLEKVNNSLARHFCSQCGYNSDDIFWRCPQCHRWETIQFRWKI